MVNGSQRPEPARRFIAPISLTLLAAFLRLADLDAFAGGVDHAYPIAQVIQSLQTGQWPALGQYTSVLVDNPPGMPYLLLGPWWLFQNVWVMHALVALANVLAVPLIYSGLRWAMHAEPPAQAAAFLLAVNPWVIYHSQGTWVQGLLVLFTTLTFTLLAQALFGPPARRERRWLATFASLAVFTQTYLLAFFTGLQVALAVALNWKRAAGRALLAGVLIFALPTSVYVFQIAARAPAQSDKLAGFFQANRQLAFSPTALEHALRYVSGRDFGAVYGNDGSPAWQTRQRLAGVLSGVLELSVLAGAGYALWQVARRTPRAGFWLLTLLWWSLPIAALSLPDSPIHIHYLLLSLPAGMVLSAPVLTGLVRSSLVRLAAAAVITSVWLLTLDAHNRLVLNQPAGGHLDRLSLRAGRQFQAAAGPLVDQYRLTEAYVRWDSASLTANTGRALQAVSWFELPDFQIIPLDRPALYMTLQHGQPAPVTFLAKRAAQVDYAGNDYLTLDLIPAHSRAQILRLPQHPVGWPTAQGLTLVGYDLNGQQLRVYYLLEALVEGRAQWLYAPYAHFTNARGQIAANLGAAGMPGYDYRAGDVYVYQMAIPPLPAGAYTLELGLFDGLHGGRGVTFLPPGETPRPAYTIPLRWP